MSAPNHEVPHDRPQTFKLYGPTGDIIMTGSMSAIMERIPDSVARNAALEDMLKIAADAVEAEERQAEARACAIRTLSDGLTNLSTRLDSFEKQRAISAKRAEAARKEAAQQRVQRYLDELPDPDDPDLYSFDPKERSTTSAPDEVSQDPSEMGAVYDPEPHPESGSRLNSPAPQVAQPTAISLNEA